MIMLCLIPSKGDTLLTVLTMQNYDEITINSAHPHGDCKSKP
jgi:hypothetical protein